MPEQTIHPDGIYLNLPEQQYHTDPALSASGIKNLLQSPADYWFQSAHNPNYQDVNTDALSKGSLYHMAFFEPERIKAECAFKPDGMSFATKDGKQWRADHEGKTIIKASDWQEIDVAHKLATQAGLFEFIGDGPAEVSIFVTDPSGHRLKCRVDKLTPNRSFDLKTFSNSQRKDLDVCLAHAIYYERYYISAVWYMSLIEKAKSLKITDVETGEIKVQDIINPDVAHKFFLVFQQTGQVPNLAVREIEHKDFEHTTNEYFRAAQREIDYATGVYAKYMKSHGPDRPWLEPVKPKPLADTDFSSWMLE